MISADDPGAVALTEAGTAADRGRSPGPEIMTFGESDEADVQITGTRLAGTGSTFELRRAGHAGAGGAGGARPLQRVERRGGVRGGHLAGPRRGGRAAPAGHVRGHLPAVPADRLPTTSGSTTTTPTTRPRC